MAIETQELLIGVDVGAGSGAKLGLLDGDLRECATEFVPCGAYGDSVFTLADALIRGIDKMLRGVGVRADQVTAVGLACPGFIASDGTVLSCINLGFLEGRNLREALAERLGRPVACLNDGDAGGLAEWHLSRKELFYWAFGGGWGGAWISAGGAVRFPTASWNGDDASVHYSNEPGYALPLEGDRLAELFGECGVPYERFLDLCVVDFEPENGVLTGPGGRTDCLRAEFVLSGPGRWRIFTAVADQDRSFEAHLSTDEVDALRSSVPAGSVISRLGELGVEAAARTDRLFGLVLADAGLLIYEQARGDGCVENVPIVVSGGPSRALPLFGPVAREAMKAKGMGSELRLSWFERERRNANLVGAAVLARFGRSEADHEAGRES